MTTRRPSRIDPDTRPVLIVAVVITAALALVSFLLSFSGLVAVADWAAIPSMLAWAVPVTIDGAILVYTLAALVYRARGESARIAWASLSLFTTVSVIGNAAHAATNGPGGPQGVLGAVVAGLAPVAVFLTTHTIARLVVAPPTAADVEAPVEGWRHVGTMDGPTPFTPAEPVDLAALQAYTTEDVELTRRTFADRHHGRLAVPTDPEEYAAAVAEAGRALADKRATKPLTTAERHARIRELAAADPTLSLRDIAARVGVSKSTVARVLDRPADEPARISAATA
jgi:hypothetical protein